MAGLFFGTAGIPFSTQPPTTIDGVKRIAELGLGCMEIEFVRGVYLSETDAYLVAKTAEDYGVRLSAHAPYFINFNAHEPRKLRASQGILLKAARIASICGARSMVFHPGFYLGDPPQETYQTIKKYLAEVVSQLKQEDNRLWLRPEVSGKASQFGTITEIADLCSELEGLAPCIDFAHWHAHTGGFNSYPEFASVLEQIQGKLSRAALDDMHIHISGIAYGAKGEQKHLILDESDLCYIELLQALKDYGISGTVICESPNLEEDALLLKESYQALP
ncbi:MAG: TIM barrel protein [Dehalococcoidales bacterium]|nr:TIM barrel protein [Dehalococcoidales bacterium]